MTRDRRYREDILEAIAQIERYTATGAQVVEHDELVRPNTLAPDLRRCGILAHVHFGIDERMALKCVCRYNIAWKPKVWHGDGGERWRWGRTSVTGESGVPMDRQSWPAR